VALGILLLDDGRRSRLIAAGVAFGLAALARQTTLLFPLVVALWLAYGGEHPQTPATPKRRRGTAMALLALSVGPYLAYSLFLRLWLGELSDAGNVSAIPFGGLFHPPWRLGHQGVDIAFVVAPAMIALVALRPSGPLRSAPWLPWLLLAANVLLAVVFFGRLYQTTYTSMSRVATGVMLAALMCLPYVDRLPARRRRWLVATAILAVAPTAVVAVQGFTSLNGPG